MSNNWKIPCTWEMSAVVDVPKDRFKTIEEAIKFVEEGGLPKDSLYVDSSFEVNLDVIETYEENIQDD